VTPPPGGWDASREANIGSGSPQEKAEIMDDPAPVKVLDGDLDLTLLG
jgi:hypothetical protein